VIADLNTQRFLDLPEDAQSVRDRDGPVVRLGPNHFLKIVHHDNQQSLAMIDVRNGTVLDGTLANQVESFREDCYLKPDGQRLLSFDRAFLFYDNSTLSAWVTPP
ncbi:MAG: hypothetical protein GWO24_06015, partial [Akkermansiaceae bacterium]|nr:hypothetical protein [Akkermansiaceae bacterium]